MALTQPRPVVAGLTASATHADNIVGEIRQFILKSFPLARKHNVKDSEPLLESGMIDSQGILEMVSFIESRFATTVADEDLVPDNFQSIDRIAAFVRRRIAG